MKALFLLLTILISISLFARKPHLVIVVPPDKYHDTEFSDPMLALDSAGVKVTIASTKIGTIKGVLKDSIQSTMLISDVQIKRYDAICIMGGTGTGKYLWENEQLKQLIVSFDKKEKLVTGICAGAVSLARAGVLKEKKATTYPVKGFIEQLENAGAKYSADPVIIDGRIVTANGPVGTRNFGRAIVRELEK
jgi:protease I